MNVLGLLSFGTVIHIVFLFSIFDIYFKSPILSNLPSIPNNISPPGKRVVLISVDGLRTDALFDTDPENGRYVAEHVQNIMSTQGTWGVSQTRVPTESRPGHVAMLAGFYEDPSAVTRGWKENPVDFDSIFNRSDCSFAWGSPDILNIFFKGLKHNCCFVNAYENEQNFAGDSQMYDNWVYEKLELFMQFPENLPFLHKDRIFFFLHLLGQDTSGHTDKPHSIKYRKNLQNVDRLVKKIENLFYGFYNDHNTTFIITSDHGMTNWGSHGAGNLDEINTPIVLWGAGIKKASDLLQKYNISQADITPLLAILLGSSVPVNSIGVLPYEFLNISEAHVAQAFLLNARQIAVQYVKAAENTKQQTISLFYSSFDKLPVLTMNSSFQAITDLINSKKYLEVITKSKKIIELSLKGLDYYYNYYQIPLLISVALSYLGWIAYLLLSFLENENFIHPLYGKVFRLSFCCSILITLCFIAIQKLPISFYSYFLLPQVLWYLVIKKVFTIIPVLATLAKKRHIIFVLSTILGVEIFVITFFYRWFLCLSLGIVFFWVISISKMDYLKGAKILWLISGIASGMFSMLPIVGNQPDTTLILSSGFCICLLAIIFAYSTKHGYNFYFFLQLVALIVAVWNSYFIHKYFNENHTLLKFNQLTSWVLLVMSFFSLFFRHKDTLHKLTGTFLSLVVPFILLSITHEGFFIIIFFIHLICWIFIEESIKHQYSFYSDFRIAYIFLNYIFLSFFGLGNITSLNSFDTAWVRCFVTVFSPFLMSALIILKTIIPFLVVSCAMRTVSAIINISTERLFVIVLIFCNIMALNFLFLIKNKGSWLEIGISISHYVIQQITIVCLVLLFGVAKFLTKTSFSDFCTKRRKQSIVKPMLYLPIFKKPSKIHQF